MDRKVIEDLEKKITAFVNEVHGDGVVYLGTTEEVDPNGRTTSEIAQDVDSSLCRTLLVDSKVDGVKQTHVFAIGSLIVPYLPAGERFNTPHVVNHLSVSPYYPMVISYILDRVSRINDVKQYLVNLRRLQFLN